MVLQTARLLRKINTKMNYPWTRSLDVETGKAIDGSLKGTIPAWLEGSLLRNGSGVYQVGETKCNHLFDGLSVMHKFTVKDGKVTYMNKTLKSEAFKKDMAANRLVVSEYGTKALPDPCLTIFGRLMNRFTIPNPGDVTDNCSVNLCFYGDGLYAMTETSLIRRVDPENLETLDGVVNLAKYVAIHHATAHPHIDGDGTVYNMGNVHGKNGSYRIIKFPPKSSGESDGFPIGSVVATIPLKNPMKRSYFHSFGITDNYFVFAEMSLIFNAFRMLSSNLRNVPFSDALEWDPSKKSVFHIIHRTTGERTVFLAEPFFCFHHINAFEEDGHVVVDLCCTDDGRLMNDLTLKNIDPTVNETRPALPVTKPRRYILPLQVKDANVGENLVTLSNTMATAVKDNSGNILCHFEEIANCSSELPRINYRLNGKPYRYFYSISAPEGTIDPKQVLKVDIQSKTVLSFSEEGKTVSEPVFVPKPGSDSEDDGLVLFSMLDDYDPLKVSLVILDAQSLQEVARTDFQASGVVPKDFHGLFVSSSEKVHLY